MIYIYLNLPLLKWSSKSRAVNALTNIKTTKSSIRISHLSYDKKRVDFLIKPNEKDVEEWLSIIIRPYVQVVYYDG
jgi:hypothetical protein